MSKVIILSELESLKDLVNDNGKGQIERIKGMVASLVDQDGKVEVAKSGKESQHGPEEENEESEEEGEVKEPDDEPEGEKELIAEAKAGESFERLNTQDKSKVPKPKRRPYKRRKVK